MKGKYKFVGFLVEIDSNHYFVHRQCADYVCNELADPSITIKTTQKDIDDERERAKENDIIEKSAAENMSDDHLESLAIYRRICDTISQHNCLLIHGCAVSAYGKAYLFVADSGVGKSTHAKLWLKRFGNRAEIINGNNPILKIVNNEVLVYGTPWCGREGLNQNKCIPLSAICLLKRDKKNHIHEISTTDGYAKILRQCYKTSDPNKVSGIISNLRRILSLVDLYSLGCNREPSAAVVAYEGMKNKTKNTIL
ncbi:MAG: hypothetical protein IJA12_00970 [Oscillospiraceae bacterium]|nr:hypothetical protein [Oscillospiraceae bacterium]